MLLPSLSQHVVLPDSPAISQPHAAPTLLPADCLLPALPAGETANGQFPHAAVRTMAAIAANAELGVDYSSRYDFIRFNNAGKEPVSPDEATLSGVAKAAMDFCLDRDGDGVVDITEGELRMSCACGLQLLRMVAYSTYSVPAARQACWQDF